MLADLEKYTGRRITVDASGYAWFAGTPFGRQYASRADMDWIWRVQNDDSETDLSVLWTHLSGGDDWHRRRFQQAWLDYSGLETPQEAFNRGGMAGWEGFKEGITFGGYQAPEWARRTEGFGISRGIGQATAIFELSVATVGIGQALGASGGLGAGLARVGATAATTAAGAASTSVGERVLRQAPPAFAPGEWLRHFMKHGSEFGISNSVEYLRAAQKLVSGGSGVYTFTRSNGDVLFYRPTTNEFAVLTSRNVIRTFFKPAEGVLYWFQQTGQLILQ